MPVCRGRDAEAELVPPLIPAATAPTPGFRGPSSRALACHDVIRAFGWHGGSGAAWPERQRTDEARSSWSASARPSTTSSPVADLDLEIADGEFFSLLGPSGSGKTTVLRMIAGFEKPTAGAILLGGQEVTSLAPYDRDVNTVFQDYALFPHMTVQQNVEYGLKVKGVDRSGRRRRAGEMLEIMRLSRLRLTAPQPVVGRAAPAGGARPSARQQSPASSCSTNHWVRSTSSCARRCRSSCARSSVRWASRSSSSLTTRVRHCR